MYKSLMHVAFFTDNMEEMITFYTEKLGCKLVSMVRYSEYLGRADRPSRQKKALETPNAVVNAYIEVAPNEFVEFFPKNEGQLEHPDWNISLGYSHFSLLVDDIFETRKHLEARGVEFDTDISKGPSETYQMWVHDPDGNKIEIMQFTEKSYQLTGHFTPLISPTKE